GGRVWRNGGGGKVEHDRWRRRAGHGGRVWRAPGERFGATTRRAVDAERGMAMLVREEIARAASEVHSAARRPQALSAVLSDLDRAMRAGESRRRQPAPTGFAMLDRTISGGLKPGELMLIGGAQGLGKTTLTLQMARNMAAAGANVLYVCYEHEE